MGSFLSPEVAFGGLLLVVVAVFHGVHSMSATASADQLLSSVSLLTVRVRKTPALLPATCSSTAVHNFSASALLDSVPESTLHLF